jgi:F-type H+-transporting ATPase subunit b
MATEITVVDAAIAAVPPSTCVNQFGNAIGMPQLCADWIPNQIFWLLVTLGVIFYVLSRIALPRIGAVLAERQGTITNDIAAAEDLRQQAVAADKAYNDALAQARDEANKIVAEAKAGIQKDLNAAMVRADAEISAKTAQSEQRIGEIRAGAMAAVTEVARDTAREIVTAFGGKADARNVTAAVSQRLKG